ncbi:MAG: hypothetical protein A2268_04950 [Candidatus Raymondbacteria bacterium RifOxyA12_full_50_37]|uniref:Uncharacterized protein n=1 Tax=Candidatus Raymondbacteria bacterium RIFOXYD12_FULL_49_13 TaxID=1817890 RepID=A0A1F7FDP9_UNCRA|nr:MAG: hypothetical protein A2268_04950 [Candidatus Raymondbacteria bacterium RifOxyA12_full_50_37]OGJ94091.1 MAG: hypothetical protein A2248_12155 [Candidatus Raymondbacteria bacterium RIFOXYA2_FULL_49_16]OGJ96916.1 MAG: hypothetical protein A2453_04755 [Candidatus Raymondbacteria bacterium RIFOXYC2_FULL_50_21]OGK03018.1 MAG: hypothetical protein A2350_03620 [Candidatus Raymondbacteria bacterium RifOxyB12_full_50_8]OGK04642.1 MAG: hypothetical protein A2519_20920 [Candidatus Raymondbacteria b
MPLEHSTDIMVRYAETDQMGMVHHVSYAVYFEEARTKNLAAAGLPYHLMEERGVLLPVVELTLQYLKPAKFGEYVTVKSVISPPQGARLRVEYRILRGDDLLVTGSTIHAFMGKNGRPIRPPGDIIAVLS